MKTDEKGVIKWISARNLYRDDFWYKLKACLKAWGVTALVMFFFLFILFLIAEKFRFSLKLFTVPSIVGGGAFVFLTAFTLPSLFLLAWANGGVDEWEYEMDDDGIRGRKIVRKAWRMKLLRGLAWIAMLLPSRPNQKMALRPLLFDNLNKKTDVSFASVKGVSFDEKKCQIALETTGDSKDIHVPREDYAEVLAYIEERIPKKKPKRQRTGGRKKASTTDSERKQQ